MNLTLCETIEGIETFFDIRNILIKRYHTWSIDFPIETFENKYYTFINQHCGWQIYYQFTDHFMEICALHRMSDINHCIISINGDLYRYMLEKDESYSTFKTRLYTHLYNHDDGVLRCRLDTYKGQILVYNIPYAANYRGSN